MKDRSDDTSHHERTLLPQSYISLCLSLASDDNLVFLKHSMYVSMNFCPRFYNEGNILFNDILNTFYLQLYGVRHMVEDHSESGGNPLLPHGLLFPTSSKGSFICIIPDRMAHTTAFVTPVMEHWLEQVL